MTVDYEKLDNQLYSTVYILIDNVKKLVLSMTCKRDNNSSKDDIKISTITDLVFQQELKS